MNILDIRGSVFQPAHGMLPAVALPCILMRLSGLVILRLAVRRSGRGAAAGGVYMSMSHGVVQFWQLIGIFRTFQSAVRAIRRPPAQTTSKAYGAGHRLADWSFGFGALPCNVRMFHSLIKRQSMVFMDVMVHIQFDFDLLFIVFFFFK